MTIFILYEGSVVGGHSPSRVFDSLEKAKNAVKFNVDWRFMEWTNESYWSANNPAMYNYPDYWVIKEYTVE